MYHQTCWTKAWFLWAHSSDLKNQEKFVKYNDSNDEWFDTVHELDDTNFHGSLEDWAAMRTLGIKAGELEKWIFKRQLGLTAPSNRPQYRARNMISKYPWYWPIAADIAKSTYTNDDLVGCPCVLRNGQPCWWKKCKYEQRFFKWDSLHSCRVYVKNSK